MIHLSSFCIRIDCIRAVMNRVLTNHTLGMQRGWMILSFVSLLHIAIFWSVMNTQSHQALPEMSMAQPLSVRWVTPEPVISPQPEVQEPTPEIVEPEPLPPPKVETPSPIKIKPKPVVKKKPKPVKPVEKKVTQQKPTQALPVPSAPVVNRTDNQKVVTTAEPAPVTEQPKFNAAYLSNPAPVYPKRSRMLVEEGIVKLKVRVSADGQPLSVALEKSSGFSRLDDAALAAVKRWQFVPAKRGDQSIEGWVIVPVSFKLRS